jgi:hypothetical protein
MAEKYKTDEVIQAIEEAHGNISAAARRLGAHRNTIASYIKKYATVGAAYEEARETLIDFTENQLFNQVKEGNITAIIFTLKTIGKYRGYVERHEHTGQDGQAININVVYKDSVFSDD